MDQIFYLFLHNWEGKKWSTIKVLFKKNSLKIQKITAQSMPVDKPCFLKWKNKRP